MNKSMVSEASVRTLLRDKYPDLKYTDASIGLASGNKEVDTEVAKDVERLAAGEPLAYVIGWIPFLGLHLHLDSPSSAPSAAEALAEEKAIQGGRPLIPRPETEWWTEQLIEHLKKNPSIYGGAHGGTLRVLDLCAGSGAIGLAILKHVPNVHVSFGEISPEHAKLIEKNLYANDLDASRADIRSGDLFEPFSPASSKSPAAALKNTSIYGSIFDAAHEQFDCIATNPPYIPQGRTLDQSVASFEPAEALFSGPDGLDLIRRIAIEAPQHILPDGELWMECDTSNIEDAKLLALAGGAHSADIRTDQYGRPRVLVAHY